MTTTHTDNQHTARNQVLAIVLTSYLMIVLDISIVITGLPDIQKSWGFSPVALSWVQSAYLLSFRGFLLLAARAGDLFGRKRMLLAGLALFTTASLAVGLASTPAWLIGWGYFQGIGAAILAPSVLSLISTTFPEGAERHERFPITPWVRWRELLSHHWCSAATLPARSRGGLASLSTCPSGLCSWRARRGSYANWSLHRRSGPARCPHLDGRDDFPGLRHRAVRRTGLVITADAHRSLMRFSPACHLRCH